QFQQNYFDWQCRARPEVREFNGKKMASFSVAVNEKYTKSNGEPVEKTDWFRVSYWGSTADIVEKYVKKGAQVHIEGRLSTSEYTDKEGKLRTALEVSGQQLTLLGSAGGSGTGSAETKVADNPAPYNQPEPPTNPEDDLPF
ncbi:MAG: single-stranded DNA-binding protein, partial [Microscillaceae bacterium]|nr:single-stranded DNA-binding protein [Microscillaceae bacterium]